MLGLIRTFKCPPETKKDSFEVQMLKEAKALVKQGWCKGLDHKLINGKIHYCISGAIHKVNATQWHNIYDIFAKANNLEAYGIPKWNDRIWRTKWSVLRAFNRAIAFAQKESTKICPPLP